MTAKINKTRRLTKALLETAKDMKDAGVLGKATYEKITMRHLSLKDKNKLVEPLTGKDIRMIREQAHLSQVIAQK
jgi:putative transcriptional regulator